MMSKSDLRKQLRDQRHGFAKAHIFTIPNNVSASLGKLVCESGVTACYASAHGEPDVTSFGELAVQSGRMAALPWLSPTLTKADARASTITFRQWTPGDVLEHTALGFWQPNSGAAPVAPELILTPLLGFDRQLNRLGQGAGHYDRAFSTWPDAIRIGICWSVQEVDALPVDAWDVPLDAVLTEKEWIIGPQSRIPQPRNTR